MKNCILCKKSIYKTSTYCKECFNSGILPKKGGHIKCIVCGKDRFYSLTKISLGAKFCSNQCKFKIINVRKYGFKPCEICKKEFYYPPHKKKRNTRFCSRTCSGKFNVKNLGTRMKGRKFSIEHRNKISIANMKGLPNTRFKYSNIRSRIEKDIRYKLWQYEVYDRCNYRCVSCGSQDKLQCHHRIPFASIFSFLKRIVNKQYIETSIKILPLTFDQVNGEILCVSCHSKTDSYYTNGTNGVYENYFSSIYEYLLNGLIHENVNVYSGRYKEILCKLPK